MTWLTFFSQPQGTPHTRRSGSEHHTPVPGKGKRQKQGKMQKVEGKMGDAESWKLRIADCGFAASLRQAGQRRDRGEVECWRDAGMDMVGPKSTLIRLDWA